MYFLIRGGNHNKLNKILKCNRRQITTKTVKATTANEEYTKEPEYPPIEDVHFTAKLFRQRESWRNNIKQLNTVEEKLFAINMPKYYGYKSLIFNDTKFHYNCLPLIQYSTRTILDDKGIHNFYQKNNEKVENILKSIKLDVEDAIAFELVGYKNTKRNLVNPDNNSDETVARKRSERILLQINRILLNVLAEENSHLSEIELDLEPRHEAFWSLGGIKPPERIRKIRKGLPWLKEYADEPVDRYYQYIGKPILALRHQYPLEPIEQFTAEVVETVPKYNYDPRTIGYMYDYRTATTVPGFWPGSPQELGLLSYHCRNHIQFRDKAFGKDDDQNALHAQAILCSWGWLLGQACYQGFSIFDDPTYPLTTQTILSDGQFWSFYSYQLNTTRLHRDAIETNPKANQCWGTKELKLYEGISDKGQIVGFNDDVLRNLIHFYINEPKQRPNVNMKPYLGQEEKKIADIEDTLRREFLESHYKHSVSVRPRHRLIPEIYHWEKIYKIDNNTKPLAPKRRFFELNINPFSRRLEDHTPNYIPKVLRAPGSKKKDRWAKTFYPKGV